MLQILSSGIILSLLMAEVSQELDVALSVPHLLAYQCTKHQQSSDSDGTANASPWCVRLVICVRSLGQH